MLVQLQVHVGLCRAFDRTLSALARPVRLGGIKRTEHRSEPVAPHVKKRPKPMPNRRALRLLRLATRVIAPVPHLPARLRSMPSTGKKFPGLLHNVAEFHSSGMHFATGRELRSIFRIPVRSQTQYFSEAHSGLCARVTTFGLRFECR